MSNLTEILEKIEVEKQLLSVMPKNNHKNIVKYLEKIKELETEYAGYNDKIIKTLTDRYKEATKIEKNNEIENLEKRLNTIEKTLYLLSDEKTSYEKLELDKIIYKIGRYYKGNLENINEQIKKAIAQFASIGISLELSDFDYSIYVQQYMKTFFEERRKDGINSNILKAKFEEIYWKCPDIIIHIELNIRNIYFNKQTQIDKYFEKEKAQLLKQWGKTPKEIMNSYLGIKQQQQEVIAQDKKIQIEKFLNGEWNTSNYSQDKIQTNYSKILLPTIITQIDTNKEEIQRSILEFLNSLYEYKNYLNFQYIVDDVKKYYKEKDKYKKSYEDTKKKILDSEKKLKKLNKKASSKGLFGKKKEIKQTTEQNQMVLEIKKLYKELDLNKFYSKISNNLEDDSTIYDILNLANSYYNYLTFCMIENNKTITQEKMDEQIKKIDEFLKNPYNNIITNLTITDDRDIAMIIKDRYQLLNFNVKQDDLSAKNLDNLINVLENIITSWNLNKNGIDIKNIEEILKIRDTFKL
ncbi:MAG: hypothetical protein IJE68_00350 [Clostridia bacterium]|nr:hypothetical protein [Clostridia bacterium]